MCHALLPADWPKQNTHDGRPPFLTPLFSPPVLEGRRQNPHRAHVRPAASEVSVAPIRAAQARAGAPLGVMTGAPTTQGSEKGTRRRHAKRVKGA